MDGLPECGTEPTITPCLIAQANLAKIVKCFQVEKHHLPTQQIISAWHHELAPHFDFNVPLEPHFDIPRRVMLWRSFHLRIVINHPFLFQSVAAKSALITSDGPAAACLATADECHVDL